MAYVSSNCLVYIIIAFCLFIIFVCLIGGPQAKDEKFPSGANTLDSTTRLSGTGIAGPVPWAPAIINARARAEGSPYRVPPNWIPTSPPWEPYASTHSVPRRLKEKSAN